MSVKILVGDVMKRIKELPDNSIDCCVTSPPYWGLRDYGTAQWEGGNPNCQHTIFEAYQDKIRATGRPVRNKDRSCCIKCGAKRIDKQIGLEPSPKEHIEALLGVFSEIKRILKETGTLWVNYGDCYATTANGRLAKDIVGDDRKFTDKPFSTVCAGLKPKDLVGMPWRLALALQDDGWWLRQDIIWDKPNPMPESVKDRFVKSHEYLFLLTKSPKYFFDYKAVQEPAVYVGIKGQDASGYKDARKYNGKHSDKNVLYKDQAEEYSKLRNKRSVWNVATRPFKEAHFATFPPELIRPCVLAGCPKGGLILDPFGGAGTTAIVAEQEQRNSILIELNSEYVEITKKRITKDCGLFTEMVVE